MIPKQKIIDIYNNLDIPSWTEGKNVTQGWVEVQCPFCADSSHHCGVHPETELFSCWICGKKGHFTDLLMELTGLSFSECKNLISDSSATFKKRPLDMIKEKLLGESIVEQQAKIFTNHIKLPDTFELVTYDTNFSLLDSYLERRDVSIDTIVKHKCGVCRAGYYMNRLIIPIFYQGKLVSYQAADLTGFANLKYRSAPLSISRINDFLYNYDEIKVGGRMIIVEGVLDAWRIGVEAVAAFTSHLTKAQKKLIIAKNLEELYFCFDCELTAYYKAKKEAEEFKDSIPVVEVVRLPFGKDPDKLSRGKIYECILETRE